MTRAGNGKPGTPEARLYVILGSHACRTGILLLKHKGIPHRVITLPTGLHPLGLRLAGFSRNQQRVRTIEGADTRTLATADRMGTVPVLRLGEERVKTNRGIARFLERLHPHPPLFPADPDQRARVEEAEAWGDEVLQMNARRLALTCSLDGPNGMINRGADGRLGPLLWKTDRMRSIGLRLPRRAFAINPETERELLASVPAMLDRVDGWIEDGVLNGEELNAADFMIAPSLALLTYRPDVRVQIERRPALALVDRLLPEPAS